MIKHPGAALAAACLLACRAAAASPAPLAADGIPVDPSRYVSGAFPEPGSQRWRLYLRQGRHYALYGTASPGATVEVRAAGGRLLGGFPMFDSTGDAEGADWTAPYTGLYGVTVTGGPDGNGDPSSYRLSAARDCAGSAATRCGIAPGETLRGLQMSFVPTLAAGDEDWFRSDLLAGRRYLASLPAGQASCLVLGFRDAAGRPVGRDREECGDGRGGPLGPPLAITPARSGAYYVVVRPDDESTPSSYSLSLSRPR